MRYPCKIILSCSCLYFVFVLIVAIFEVFQAIETYKLDKPVLLVLIYMLELM